MSVRDPRPCLKHNYQHDEADCPDNTYIYEHIGGKPQTPYRMDFYGQLHSYKKVELKAKIRNILKKAYFNGQTDVVAKLSGSIPDYKHSDPILDFMADDIIKLFEEEDDEEQV